MRGGVSSASLAEATGWVHKISPRETPVYDGSLDNGGAVSSAPYALASVGLLAISLVNYATLRHIPP